MLEQALSESSSGVSKPTSQHTSVLEQFVPRGYRNEVPISSCKSLRLPKTIWLFIAIKVHSLSSVEMESYIKEANHRHEISFFMGPHHTRRGLSLGHVHGGGATSDSHETLFIMGVQLEWHSFCELFISALLCLHPHSISYNFLFCLLYVNYSFKIHDCVIIWTGYFTFGINAFEYTFPNCLLALSTFLR